MNFTAVWARLSVRILLFGAIFIGARVGVFLIVQSFPALAQNKSAIMVLAYGWPVLMLVLIYPFFVQPLRRGLKTNERDASILSRILKK